MTPDVVKLREYNQLKKNMIKFLKIQEKHFQRCAQELISVAVITSTGETGAISIDDVYIFAKNNIDSVMHKLLNWTETEEQIKRFIGRALDQIPFIIDSLNNVYTITKV